MVRFLAHPADLSHALPRTTLRDHAGHDSRREYGGGGMGNADRGVGSERRQRRPALDDARGCLTAQRHTRGCHRESLRRPAEARQAGAGHSRPWRRHLSQWPDRGGDELIPVRRSGGRNRCPRDTGLAGVAPGTLPDAGGDQVRKLKIMEDISLGDRDLVLWGSSTLTSTLLEHGLADEVLLIVYPVLLGTGKRFFAEGTPARSFELVSTNAMPSGAILSAYKVAGPLKTG